MSPRSRLVCGTVAAVILTASMARALPITLKDTNGTKYTVNTQVFPLPSLSNASGALTNATFVEPVTVTSYYVAFTPWFFTTSAPPGRSRSPTCRRSPRAARSSS